MSKQEYALYLDGVLDQIFSRADDLRLDSKQLSKRAKLSFVTVHNINHRKTQSPHLRTVVSLAVAVGLTFIAVEIKNNRSRVA